MLKRFSITALIAAVAFALTGCERANESEYREQLVLEGVLYVEHPLAVRLTRTVPISQYYDNSQLGVSGAEVRIWADGHEFVLPEDALHPGTYSLPADSHIVTPGLPYEIAVQTNGHTIAGRTARAPGPLRIDSTSFAEWRDSTRMDTIEYGDREFFMYWNTDSLTDGYAILIENLEPDWFEEYREVSGENGGFATNSWIWAQRNIDHFLVPWIVLNYTGRYRVRVLSCDRVGYEYLMTSYLGQPNNRPQSNIEGALGVFCAVGADTAYFYLKDDIKD